MTSIQLVAIIVVVVPALVIVLWPLYRGGARSGRASAPAAARGDNRLELREEKTSVYRALKELTFDYEAGHLSEDDYRGLHQRYESRAADLLAAEDALGPVASAAQPVRAPASPGAAPARRGWTRHPVTLVAGAALLLVFGVVIGLNVGRFTEPEQMVTPPGSRLPIPAPQGSAGVGPPTVTLEPGKPIPPAMLAGMLGAARQSLMAGRYGEAIAAYQAVLKRDPKNVDAMTHLGLIVSIGGHADAALETFDKAATVDASYAPIYLYRGQVLYEVKQDYPGAVQAWQRFLALVPQGEDHDRVALLVKEAQDKQRAR
jgi:tetratricopeptide (TPR) repeat protein